MSQLEVNSILVNHPLRSAEQFFHCFHVFIFWKSDPHSSLTCFPNTHKTFLPSCSLLCKTLFSIKSLCCFDIHRLLYTVVCEMSPFKWRFSLYPRDLCTVTVQGKEPLRPSPPLSPEAHAVQFSFKCLQLFIQNVTVAPEGIAMLESDLYVDRGCYMVLAAIEADDTGEVEEPLLIH